MGLDDMPRAPQPARDEAGQNEPDRAAAAAQIAHDTGDRGLGFRAQLTLPVVVNVQALTETFLALAGPISIGVADPPSMLVEARYVLGDQRSTLLTGRVGRNQAWWR